MKSLIVINARYAMVADRIGDTVYPPREAVDMRGEGYVRFTDHQAGHLMDAIVSKVKQWEGWTVEDRRKAADSSPTT